MTQPRCTQTYNDTSDATRGVAALLEVLRDDRENTWGKSHIEKTVGFGLSLLEVLKVLVKTEEGLVLVILARDVGAEIAKLIELLFHLFGRCLHVGSDAADVFVMVHLGSRIAHDANVLGEELVAVLSILSATQIALAASVLSGARVKEKQMQIVEVGAYQTEERGVLRKGQFYLHSSQKKGGAERTVFFLARSPEAPSTMMMVFCFSSIVLYN